MNSDIQSERTLILKISDSRQIAKEIKLFNQPRVLRVALSDAGWKILNMLAHQPRYPAQIAKELGLYRQKVYYYIRNLLKAGLIYICEEKVIEGGLARYYAVSSPSFGVELPFGEIEVKAPKILDKRLKSFWHPLIEEGELRSKIVVGSPEPHGPNKTRARDGHYATHLALFLGSFSQIRDDFAVKLDVDVKTEKEEKNNLVLIGGPGTNLLTAEVNRHLPIRFDEKNYWTGLRDGRGRVYNADSDGLVAKIRNPFDKSKSIVILAGVRHVGTKSTIIAVTQFWSELLKNYSDEDEWAVAIRGFDLNGDGKVDSVEVHT